MTTSPIYLSATSHTTLLSLHNQSIYHICPITTSPFHSCILEQLVNVTSPSHYNQSTLPLCPTATSHVTLLSHYGQFLCPLCPIVITLLSRHNHSV